MEIVKVIETLPKYAQILYNDCTMYLLKDENIAHPLRKELITVMVNNIRTQLNTIESVVIEND